MKLTQRDFHTLLPPIAATLALFLAAGFLAWWSHSNAHEAGLERDRTAEGKTRIEIRLRQFRSEEVDIRERGLTLRRLQDSGILGEERRLDWLEQVRNTQRELRLPGIKYEFAAQTPLNRTTPSGYAWFNSPLHLQLRLLHEGDLLNALDRIQQEARALVIVRSCQLMPPANVGERREAFVPLNADCHMDWLTARLPTGRN